MSFLTLLVFILSLVCSSFGYSNSNLIINTTYGPVQGYAAENVDVWLGIPYASPPIGNLRWKAPTAPSKWSAVRNATEVPSACTQIRNDSVFGGEDCLYLNIYAPTNSTFSGPLPVMFFIHGGGYTSGDSYLFGYYNGTNLATTQGVIVVTTNYRVNSFGFLALDELSDEASDGSTGNYGSQDQRFALKWVVDNIANFGGDPGQIMIFGESAGGISVCFHLASEDSFGLYQSALIESGTCDSIDFFLQYEHAVSFSTDYANGFGCDRSKFSTTSAYLSCLRSVPAETILFAQAAGDGYRPRFFPEFVWGPVIDNTPSGLRDFPTKLMMSGKWAKVPTVAGFNRDEGTVFLFSIPGVLPEITLPLNEIEVYKIIDFFWPTYKKQILSVYPLDSYDSPDAQMAAILRDYVFGCAERRALSAISEDGYPAYMYHVIYDSEFVETKIVGIYHGYELAFVFDNQLPPRIHEFSAEDQEMADAFGYYWANLVKSGDPNIGFYGKTDSSYFKWPKFDTSSKTNILFDLPISSESELYAEQCDLWDEIFVVETDEMSQAKRP